MNSGPSKSGEAAARDWLKFNDLRRSHVLSQFDNLRGRVLRRDPFDQRIPFHPFKIYRFPTEFRAPADQDPDTDWLKFRVRSGRVMLNAPDEVEVDETDGAIDPYSEEYPDVADFELDPDQITWFWISVDVESAPATPTAIVKADWDPASQDWTEFPDFQEHIIPIGSVDATVRPAQVRQIMRTDIFGDLVKFQYKDGNDGCKLKQFFTFVMGHKDVT